MEEYSVIHVTSSPHHHEANGLAERSVETIKGLWNKEEDKNKALMAYRTTPLESSCRPDELLLGRRMRNELPIQHQKACDPEGFRKRDTTLKERQKRNFDKSRRASDFADLQEGQTVWVKISHADKGKRGIVKYKAEEPDSYWIETDKRLVRRTRKHLRILPKDDIEGGEESPADEDDNRDQGRIEIERNIQPSAPRPPSTRNAKKVKNPDYVWY